MAKARKESLYECSRLVGYFAWGLVNCLALLVLGASPRSMCLRPFMAPAIVNTKDIDISEVLASGGKAVTTMDSFVKPAKSDSKNDSS